VGDCIESEGLLQIARSGSTLGGDIILRMAHNCANGRCHDVLYPERSRRVRDCALCQLWAVRLHYSLSG
jgi:hypothetical protein